MNELSLVLVQLIVNHKSVLFPSVLYDISMFLIPYYCHLIVNDIFYQPVVPCLLLISFKKSMIYNDVAHSFVQ